MRDLTGKTTKDRIINATLDIIAAEGFQKATVRKIAARGGVNVAAINYHFGSKDAVVNEAIKHILVQMKETFQCLEDNNVNPETRLRNFIHTYINTLFDYPDIIKNLIDQSIHDYPGPVEYQEYLKEEGAKLISGIIAQIRPGEDPISYLIISLQLLSCMSFPILLGSRIQETSGVDLSIPAVRSRYADQLLRNIVGH